MKQFNTVVLPKEYMDLGKDAEKRFASRYLTDVVWATLEQDRFEHWDVEGNMGSGRYKFDIKSSGNINDDRFWIEGTNVNGDKGWIKGDADYIVFERTNSWFIADREKLYHWVIQKIKDNGTKSGSGYYEIHQRAGRYDKIVMAKCSDVPKDVAKHLDK
jgi:hypothetical protein